MNFNHLFSLAHYFQKEADIKGNMAKRIFFSALSHLVPQGESARIPTTKGMIDFTALKQLIPGAKELLKYGIQACRQEIAAYTNSEIADNLLKIEDPNQFLIAASKLFLEGEWLEFYGGATWSRIASTLLKIQSCLNDYEEAKKSYDYQAQADSLMEMVAYMNVLDGLAHNTGSLMDKMVSYENAENYKENPEWNEIQNTQHEAYESEKKLKDIVRMMDAKELKNPEDVLQEILPTLEKTDAPLTMKDWMSAARQQKHQYQGTTEGREAELKQIRNKKKLMEDFQTYSIPEFKKILQKWFMLPDNIMVNQLIEYKSYFPALSFVLNNFIKAFPNNQEAKHKKRIVSEFIRILAYPPPIAKETLIENIGYYEVKKLLNSVLESIYLMEKEL